jgi:hypothetical protein
MQFKSFGIIVSCFFLLLLPVVDLNALPLQIDESKTFDDAEHYTHSVQKSTSSTNIQSPLETVFTASNGLMDAQVTHDGRLLTTWTKGVTLGGYIPPSIRLYSLPSEGSSDGRPLDILDLDIDRVLLLPGNISSFRECRSNLMSNGSILMVCADSDPGQSSFRIDIDNQTLTFPEFYGGVFVWNETNDFQKMWTYERPSPNCRGAITRSVFGNDRTVPVHFVNDSFIVYLNCLNNQVTTLGESNLSCPNSFIGCSAVVQFDMFGNTSNIVYMQYQYAGTAGNGPYPCNLQGLDVTPDGYIEIYTYNTCKFYNSSGIHVHTTVSSFEWVVFDSNFNLQRNFPVSVGNDLDILEIETTHITTYFSTIMEIANPGFTAIEKSWLGNNITRWDNGGNAHPYLFSIIARDNMNQTTNWAYTWSTNGYTSSQPSGIQAVSDGIFWGGIGRGSVRINWNDEMDFRYPPTPEPSSTDNAYGAFFQENGTWLDTPKGDNSCGASQKGSHIQDTPIGISCLLYDFSGISPSSGFHLFSHDFDLDGVGDSIDAFPNETTQWYDEDLDGFGNNPNGPNSDDCKSEFGDSILDRKGCLDSDGDGQSNLNDVYPTDASQYIDSDYDGYGDNLTGTRGDHCPDAYGESTRNNTYGCPDTDFDGWADSQDHFPNESSQWKDSDGDGYGDEFNGLEGDDCIDTQGTSYLDRFGCSDADSDGVSDKNDAFPNNPSQTNDRDGDGYGDNQSDDATQIDRFSSDTTQWDDTDGDGYGDNQNGNLPDRFPNDPSRWQDSDQDGVADEDDSFPDDATQDTDSDDDGYGDNAAGNRGDTFPNDAEEWSDTDGDGIGNNADAFPFDPSQQIDSDGDGFGDNERGSGADKFPSDSTQWSDIDGDGYGDNAEGTNPDAFIADPTQWADADGDGYGDNPTGRLADVFTEDPTQWIDEDGDGLGDNQSGTNADPSLNDFDNDGYNDSIDPLPKLASPGDLDNDGVLDVNDLFPEDFREWADYDGDGEGDNADTDDDNDGWADTDEIRVGTDPFNSAEEPVESFEIVIPGTAVGLGAWDLIGMFGGIPLFMWIGFGFATRNGRTAKYEALLRQSQTRDELEDVARKWEYSLMLRMLGPHQGIRLERLRAELDDVFEAQNQKLTSIEPEQHDQTQMVEKAMNVEQKSLPGLEQAVANEPMETEQAAQSVASMNVPTADTAAQRADENGYEWFTKDDGTNFYRTVGSGAEWVKFED